MHHFSIVGNDGGVLPSYRFFFDSLYALNALRAGPFFENPNHSTETAIPKKPKAIQVKYMKIKSMLNLSLESANVIYTCASIIAVTAAFISAFAGVLTYMASSIQDRYADQAIADANSMSAQANDAAAQANVRTKELTKQNLELSIQLELEKKERLRMESSLGPRVLTDQKIDDLAKSLSVLQGAAAVMVRIARQDPEVINYANQIISSFKKAGVITQISNTTTLSTGANTGVHVVIFEGPGHTTIEQAIKEAEIASSIIRATQNSENKNYGFDRSIIAAVITIFPKSPHL